ncbi:MAG: hypothetical protein WC432_06960, partial [Candidatus Omnitrophota bacterium]
MLSAIKAQSRANHGLGSTSLTILSERSESKDESALKEAGIFFGVFSPGIGRMAEWSNAAVSKTVRSQGLAGSNPAP